MKNYHHILTRLQEYIKCNDISKKDVPIGIEIFASGSIYVPYSYSTKKMPDIESAFKHIDTFLKENNS